jgi:tol-pal system protein YbgF
LRRTILRNEAKSPGAGVLSGCRWAPASGVLVISLLCGCGSLLRQPVNVEATRAEVETLRRDQTELLALVRELRLRLDGLSEDVASMRADQNAQLRQLESRLNVLTAQLEEQGLRFERLRQDDRQSPGTPAPDTTVKAVEGPGAAGSVPESSALAIYQAAQRDFARGNYELAVAGYEEFLNLSPESPEADDAQYWIGESYYSLGELDRSIQEFLKVRDLHADGDQVAAATLKIAYAFLRKGDSATARRYLETLIREFPDSNEERLARDKLKTLR